MKRILVLALLLLAGVAQAQPVVSGGWRPPVGCSSGQVIQFNGTAWVCGNITAFSTNNVIPKGNGTTLVASSWTDNGTTSTTTGGLAVNGNATIGASTSNNHTINGRATLAMAGGVTGFTIAPVASAVTTETRLINGVLTGTVDTTAGALNSTGAIFTVDTTRSAGPNDLTNRALFLRASGGQVNRALHIQGGEIYLENSNISHLVGNVVFNQTSGTFATNGNTTLGSSTASNNHVVNGSLAVTRAVTASTATRNAITVSQAGTFDTTAGTLDSIGVSVTATSTRSAGASDLVNKAMVLSASGGQLNVALQTSNGANYLNSSSGSSGFGYAPGATLPAKLSVSGTFDATGAATLGSTLNVTGNATLGSTPGTDTHLLNGATTIRTGTPSGVSAAPGGTTLAIESANGTANYFVLRSNTVKGFVFANPSNGFDAAVTYDSIASRSLGFSSAGSTRLQVDSSGSFFLGDTANTAVGDNVHVVTIGNTGTGQTANTALINASHTGSFNTTAGTTVAIGVRSEISATRSTGANTLRNVAFFANSSGGQENYAFRNDTGDNLFNAVSGSSAFAGNVVVGSAASNTLTVNATTQRGLRNHIADTYFEWNDEWMSTLSQSGSGGTNTALVGGEAEYISTVTGTGTTSATISALSVQGHPGVVRFDTGQVTNANISRVTDRASIAANASGVNTFEWVGKFPVLSSSTQGYAAVIGFWNALAVNQTNGCWFLYDERNGATGGPNAGNAQKLSCWCQGVSAVGNKKFLMDGTTVSDGGFTTVNAPVAADTWMDLKVVITGTSLAEFYVNNVKSCQITTNIPGATDFYGAGWMMIKSSGTTAAQMDTDWSGLSIRLGSAR